MAETKKAPEKPKKRGRERKKKKIINISEKVYIKKKERKTGVSRRIINTLYIL